MDSNATILSGPVTFRGRKYSSRAASTSRGRLDFGIGTYFVPEGTGRIIERARDVRVVVNLDENGNAAIKDVLVDGEPFDPNSE